MAGRPMLLPAALLALAAAAAFCGTSAFVGGNYRASSTVSLRAGAARGALPAGAEILADSSVATSLAVSTPGFWANIVTVLVPCSFLIILYLQSERTKAEAEQGL
mmetsp:Transcript_88142/g.273834  ORF Transcript_88142/g.273834 Transcript_88142/m.273834 type:complete len:105 (+) Transcript_88142:98-412(+)